MRASRTYIFVFRRDVIVHFDQRLAVGVLSQSDGMIGTELIFCNSFIDKHPSLHRVTAHCIHLNISIPKLKPHIREA